MNSRGATAAAAMDDHYTQYTMPYVNLAPLLKVQSPTEQLIKLTYHLPLPVNHLFFLRVLTETLSQEYPLLEGMSG